ncbi:hypothetical protein NP233_g11728 [Leucocoprinus birnbaumii]|uniref:Uncharacterized protein n=1 Tax=Leucocoprinus birnbaumii TaxID=56174 RepID=A0AAD5YQP1_9AGAR|nr:hypothetical protein NP233_g11728 [Leucocoprinus birnbaumii]
MTSAAFVMDGVTSLLPRFEAWQYAAVFVLSTDAPLDIRSETKFRRLKAFAESAKISGLAKKGRPGVLVFDGDKEAIRTFLSNARSLRYLDFHHVDTVTVPSQTTQRLANGRVGLREVNDMAELVQRLDEMSMKEWFRQNMGMAKGP